MKTQEEVVRQHAVGPINIYKIYQEGYQDRELDDWSAFRREAALRIYCSQTHRSAKGAIEEADELIENLKNH